MNTDMERAMRFLEDETPGKDEIFPTEEARRLALDAVRRIGALRRHEKRRRAAERLARPSIFARLLRKRITHFRLEELENLRRRSRNVPLQGFELLMAKRVLECCREAVGEVELDGWCALYIREWRTASAPAFARFIFSASGRTWICCDGVFMS